MAFPAISTGVYGCQADEAALAEYGGGVEVTFCRFSEESAGHHKKALV